MMAEQTQDLCVIHSIQPQDTLAVLAVYREAVFSIRHPAYSSAILAELASRSPDEFDRLGQTRLRYVAKDQERIVGYAGLDTSRSVLTECYVAPAYNGRGIGTQLIAHVKNRAIEKSLTTLSVLSALNAVGFYERNGFTPQDEAYLEMGNGLRMPCINMHCRIETTGSFTDVMR